MDPPPDWRGGKGCCSLYCLACKANIHLSPLFVLRSIKTSNMVAESWGKRDRNLGIAMFGSKFVQDRHGGPKKGCVRVIDIVGCSPHFVHEVHELANAGGSLARKPGRGRSDKIWSDASEVMVTQRQIQAAVISRMVKKLNMLGWIIRRAVLGAFSYTRRRRQLL